VRKAIPLSVINRPVLAYDAVPRQEIPSVPSERRIGVPEIELGYGEDQARLEGARCLQCFDNIALSTDLCILCGGCVDVCPENCIRIVPLEEIEGLETSEPGKPASAMIIQEDFCIRCALCVERCPTDALSVVGWTETSTGLKQLESANA
jgi:NAD-dependent dihydropyrimidine dehydrogenase PreA subunit